MDSDLVVSYVRALVLRVLPPVSSPDAVADDAPLGEEGLGFDSVGLVNLLCACEERFEIQLPAEVLLEGDGDGLTVGRLVAHIRARL